MKAYRLAKKAKQQQQAQQPDIKRLLLIFFKMHLETK
jgi:hypothetical protein